ncbi:hypothetical protein ACH5RR_036282 [Cinchona calisaya]|uniref:Glycosyltransferase n=1 Tax=Cinchona calisaya TaxID=153742 RepID=A0ABD2Y3Y7_9GENT
MEKAHMVFIPWPTMGHLAQLVELAKLMIQRSEKRFSITILIMELPDSIDSAGNTLINSLVASTTTEGIQFFHLPPTNPSPEWSSRTRGYFVHKLIESQKPHVKNFIDQSRIHQSPNEKLVGCVIDMLCTTMIDVAEDSGLPSYVFFTSGAGFLGLMLHFQTLQDEHNQEISEISDSRTPLPFPSFNYPVPPNVLPLMLLYKQSWSDRFLLYARDYRKAKAIIINTFPELESHALNSFSVPGASYGIPRLPQIYSVGPILNQVRQQHGSHDGQSNIMKWLDDQPQNSVVYVCFGSQGSLQEDQVKELAYGLEQSGYKFLWSLRKPSPENNTAAFPSEYMNYQEVLPEGFLDRTSTVGKVTGWVSQLDILSHAAVGGFVSHCGWNSVLESIWCGVPIATWPLHSEQHLNAFQLVQELGLAVAITFDYQEWNKNQALITTEEVEKGIRRVMECESEVRQRAKQMRDKSRMSMTEGGSSYKSLLNLIEHMLLNTH